MPKSRALQRQLGQYWTPEVLVDFMLDIAQFQRDWKVIDPACGEGGLPQACVGARRTSEPSCADDK